MKRNSKFVLSILDRFLYFVESYGLKKKLIPIYSFSALLFIWILIFGPSPTAGDTVTNFSAGTVLANGKLDALRTPVYPLVLHFFECIWNNNIAVKLGVIIFQYLIFCVSIYCFYCISAYFIKNKGIVFLLALCYACHPAILVWQKIMITESLALSGMVFFFYVTIRFLVTKKGVYSLLINLLVLLLVMLRPGFLFLIPIILCFWLYFIYKKGEKGLIGLTGIACVVILTIGYAGIYQKQYGVFTLSTVSDMNQYMILRDAGLIETSSIENIEFKKAVTDSIQKKKTVSGYFDEYIYFYSNYGFTGSDKFVHESIKRNLPEYAKYNLKRFVRETTASSVCYWDGFSQNKYNPFIKFLCCPFVLLYIFLILYLCLLFQNKLSFKSSLFIYTITISSILVLILGAPNAWGRLIVPTIPLLLIMFGQCLEIIVSGKIEQSKIAAYFK